MDVEDGQADREIADDGLVGGADPFVDETDVGGGSSHVEGDEAGKAGGRAHDLGADYACGWAGEDGLDCLTAGA